MFGLQLTPYTKKQHILHVILYSYFLGVLCILFLGFERFFFKVTHTSE